MQCKIALGVSVKTIGVSLFIRAIIRSVLKARMRSMLSQDQASESAHSNRKHLPGNEPLFSADFESIFSTVAGRCARLHSSA
jgi:hypothetical protein